MLSRAVRRVGVLAKRDPPSCLTQQSQVDNFFTLTPGRDLLRDTLGRRGCARASTQPSGVKLSCAVRRVGVLAKRDPPSCLTQQSQADKIFSLMPGRELLRDTLGRRDCTLGRRGSARAPSQPECN